MTEAKEIKSKKPSKDAQEWFEHLREIDRKTPERLEDAAKFLSTMIAISLSIFLAVNEVGGGLVIDWPVRISLIAWILSLLSAFLVLFPFRYKCISTSVESIKKMHSRVLRTKWILLIASSALFFTALVILTALLFCRL
ncbi:MAG: hypothetical protein KAW12_19110 [Candidatus Aminicenantes bacterium]|nr:hypothetical protein [Candidatus Aminicenantes bacterium]